jgi:hypothetical protein
MPPKPNKMLPALYGGIIMAFISAVPFLNLLNCLCCAGVMLGGFMAVFFYKNEIKEGMPPLESADALALGAIAGVFGAVIGTLLTWGLLAVVGNVAGDALVNILKNTVGDKMPPEALEQMERGMAESSIGFAQLIMALVIDTLFGLLGGLIGYQVFKPKVAPVMPPPPPAPAR